jgi:uncharacterized protein YecE (DUF72 family)
VLVGRGIPCSRLFAAAYCIFDLADHRAPLQVTADFSDIRLHGPGGKYQGSYSDAALEDWARKIITRSKKLAFVYVCFDSGDSGYAPQDALRLKALLGSNIHR